MFLIPGLFVASWFAEKAQHQTLMARCMQLLSLVLSRPRAGALCPLSTSTLSRCRFISKGPNIQPWGSERAPRHRDEGFDGEQELEDVEEKLQHVMNKEVQRRKTVKYHILRRQMSPRGPPERKLTWDAMEEIRYLKQEQPEEWTVERLAEGFSVSKDEILRVLRSKFVPTPERKAKQDIKVMTKYKQQVLPSGPRMELAKQRLTSGPTGAALTSGNGNSALIPLGHQSLKLQTVQNPAALSVETKHQFSELKRSTEIAQEEMLQSTESTVEEEEDESWDGQVLSEQDIEELKTVTATPVVKKGHEMFDVDGNFLYRI